MYKGALLTKLKGHFSYVKRGTFRVLEKMGGGWALCQNVPCSLFPATPNVRSMPRSRRPMKVELPVDLS